MILRRFAVQGVLATCLAAAVTTALRWEQITYSGWFNPDEAELLAAGRRAAMQLWMPMETSSANTYLVLWPTFLGSLDLMGLPMTLRTAHVLSACAYAAVIAMVWISTARRWGWLRTALVVLPAAYMMVARHPDFFQMASEIPAMILLVVAAMIAFPHDKTVSARRLALAASVASLAPWFKVQSGLLAVALVLSASLFSFHARQKKWSRAEWTRRGLLLLGGGLAPTALIIGLMAIGGTLHLFWDEPVAFIHAYVTHNVSGLGAGLGDTTAPASQKLQELFDHVLRNVFAFSWTLLGFAALWNRKLNWAERSIRLTVLLIPIVAALATLLVIYPIYTHYLNFLFAGTAIASIASSAFAEPPSVSPRSGSRLPMACALAAMVLVLSAVEHARAGEDQAPVAHQGESTLAALCPRGSSVFVWGWAAELYAYYEWRPASRFVTYGLLLAKTPNQDHYRERFVQEMADAPPTCVVNAVGPAWFGGSSANMQLEMVLPETREWLERCYERRSVTFAADGDVRADTAVVWRRRQGCLRLDVSA